MKYGYPPKWENSLSQHQGSPLNVRELYPFYRYVNDDQAVSIVAWRPTGDQRQALVSKRQNPARVLLALLSCLVPFFSLHHLADREVESPVFRVDCDLDARLKLNQAGKYL